MKLLKFYSALVLMYFLGGPGYSSIKLPGSSSFMKQIFEKANPAHPLFSLNNHKLCKESLMRKKLYWENIYKKRVTQEVYSFQKCLRAP